MKKLIALILILVSVLSIISVAYADDPEVISIGVIATPEPIPPIATPQPTIRPDLPNYNYAEEDARCISRAIWSGTPSNPSMKTKQAYAEIIQNMVDDGRYKDTIRYTLLMSSEFPSYDPDAHRSTANDEIADYVMRSWMHAKLTGNRSYRLTPASGLRYSFYTKGNWDYIVVYDWEWNTVYDSGE